MSEGGAGREQIHPPRSCLQRGQVSTARCDRVDDDLSSTLIARCSHGAVLCAATELLSDTSRRIISMDARIARAIVQVSLATLAAWSAWRLLLRAKDAARQQRTSELQLEANIVAFSSQLIAAERALESRRAPDVRLFFDPLAETLAGARAIERVQARATAAAESRRGQHSGRAPASAGGASDDAVSASSTGRARIAIRTKFFDDWLERLTGTSAAIALDQVVLLGAGMDARVFRLECFRQRADTAKVFELDQAEVLRIKNGLIEQALAAGTVHQRPLCKRITVECDFAVSSSESLGHWSSSLRAASFDPSKPSCWLLEGLLMYLDESQQLQLLHHVTNLAAVGSQLAISHVNAQALRNATRPRGAAAAAATAATAAGAAGGADAEPTAAASSSSSSASTTPVVYASLLSQWKSFLSPALMDLLARGGWRVRTLTQLGNPDANYGQWHAPVFPMDDESKGRVIYLLMEKTK